MTAPAERHRRHGGAFTVLVNAATDWSAPSPVAEWSAGDVVDHLLTWFPSFLAGGSDVELPVYQPGTTAAPGRAQAWQAQYDAVQALLDDPATASRRFSHPRAGDHALADAIDLFYTSDVFMHAWDLARATGQEHTLDEVECVGMLAGMEPMEELIRSSGQYGARVPVPQNASAQDRLLGFIGRDPRWSV